MHTGLKNILLKGKKCAGVHINLLQLNKYDISFVILKRVKDKLEIENSGYSIPSIPDVSNFIPKNIPLVISIGGRGIIHKESDTTEVNWKQLFPNISRQDFYSQMFKNSENESILSVIRKELLDNIITEFKSFNHLIVNLFFGPVSLSLIATFLPEPDINIPNYNVTIKNLVIKNFKFTGETSKITEVIIDKELINTSILIAYCNSLSFFTGIDNIISEIETINNENKEFLYKQVYSKLSALFLILLFAILLVNFLLFDNFSKKKQEAEFKLTQHVGMFNRLEKLKKEFATKEEIIKNAGIMNSTMWSFYADRLALTLPQKVVLTELLINPVQKNISKNNEISFTKNIIEISGKTFSSVYLNDWIKLLKNEKWISNIEIKNYSQENNLIAGEFKINITLVNNPK